MVTVFTNRLIACILSISLLGAGLPTTGLAGVIGTQAQIQLEQGADLRARVDAILSRAEVQDQLLAYGVEPAEVQGRLAALTAAELRVLEERLAELPAGGDALAVIGVVFLVLLILELVGVTDIFKRI
ncbi:MAG: PA2779 family protein [Gammaproteobacteria bacterium]|jgi:hypothetical protein